MATEPLASLEVGTRSVKVIVGEFRRDGHLMVTGLGEVPSKGVRKGEIVNFDAAVSCVRAALEQAEEQSRTVIQSVYLGIAGPHIRSQENRGQTPIIPAGHEITEDHVEEALEAARAVSIPEDRVVVHTIRQKFIVDGRSVVLDPVGMTGSRLDACVVAIHGQENRVADMVRAAQTADVDVVDVAFSGLCSALAVMTPQQKENGAIVVDLGGGTTDYLVYADRAIVAAGSIGVGGDHLTNDIAVGLGAPALSAAEELKLRFGSARVTASEEEVVPVRSTAGAPASVYRRDLQLIINARLTELFEILRGILEERRLLSRLGGGVILTGGGARLEGIAELCSRVLGLPCTRGLPRDVSGLAVAAEAPEYATPVGLLKYAFRSGGNGGGYGLLQRLRDYLARRRARD